MKKVLEQFGVDPKRVRLERISASEGKRYAKMVDEFTEVIRKLGPLTLVHPEDVSRRERVEEVVNV